jgi:hypothetical protein
MLKKDISLYILQSNIECLPQVLFPQTEEIYWLHYEVHAMKCHCFSIQESCFTNIKFLSRLSYFVRKQVIAKQLWL